MSITRGDTPSWTITLLNDSGGPFPLAGCTVTVTCKSRSTVPDANALFKHFIAINALGVSTTSSGMELGPGGAAAGIITESVTSTESAAFAPGTYKWDLEVRTAEGKVHTPLRAIEETVLSGWTT